MSKNPYARLLLDAGALMTDLSNKQVALEWLELVKNAEAAVYFNENDLMIVDRQRNETFFEMSPYKFQLDRCVIYLDDTHTRGTDLKIPKGFIGTVTLGKGLTMDRLMQACMRMRMLGDGHKVQFFASNEVHTAIENQNKIGSLQVIEWAIKNSQNEIKEGLLYWGMQGLSYFKRESAKLTFEKDKNLQNYFNFYKENESTELANLYEGDRLEDSVFEILHRRSEAIQKHLSDSSNVPKKLKQGILDHLKKYAKNEKKLVHFLEEEQEVELEIEQEEERVIERPPLADPSVPSLHRDVTNFVASGTLKLTCLSGSSFISLPETLLNSSFKSIVEADAWMKNRIFATNDFKNTIKDNLFNKNDDFLRSCRWLAFSKEKNILVLLSGFEANKLMAYFREDRISLTRILPRMRQGQKLEINFNKVGIPDDLLQPMAIFSGNLYLNTQEEQKSYLNFIGYRPSPRTTKEEVLFEK